MIISTKRYVGIITVSINDNIKCLETLKQGFQRNISWNKYGSEITMQRKNSNLGYMIVPTFSNINNLFIQSLKVGENSFLSNTCH